MARAIAIPRSGWRVYRPPCQSGSLMIASRCVSLIPMAQGEWAADVAMGMMDCTISGYWIAHSSACIPPSEPPITVRRDRTPIWSRRSFWARTMSRTVTRGKSGPYALPVSRLRLTGPVLP